MSKESGGNLIMGINSWAVALVRYGAEIVEWTKEELANLDRKTRKIISMNGGLHTRSDVARLYFPRKEGGRRLISVAECVEKESKSLHGYLTDGQEWMLKAAWEEKVTVDTTEPLEDYKKRVYEEKVRDWKDKPLHGVFVRDTKEIAPEESWKWLRNGYLKKETERLICAAQEQALRTNPVKSHIDKTNDSPLCRLCSEHLQSVWHISSGCPTLEQREYRKRPDKVALRVHWELSRRYGLECGERWYEHQPIPEVENEQMKLMWDNTHH